MLSFPIKFFVHCFSTSVHMWKELIKIYLDSVEGNASLLLNILSNTHGQMAKTECESLKVLGEGIRNLFTKEVMKIKEIIAYSIIIIFRKYIDKYIKVR